MRFLPIHLDTQDKTILVVGGFGAAEAKLRTLLKTDARLVVVSTDASSEIQRWADLGQLTWHQREMVDADIEYAFLVYAATENPELNMEIATKSRECGVLVNAADHKPGCDFYTPALVDRSPVIVSIGTEGTSPGLARAIKADLESRLPSRLGSLALKIQQLRAIVTDKIPTLSARQAFWADIFGGRDLTAQIKHSDTEIEQKVIQKLQGQDELALGHVSLVGAGPGKAELLTLGARQKLHSADVIVYDRLVSQDVLDFGRREAEYIYVGKEPGGQSTPQHAINAVLVEKAKEGLTVVRLKSGDPLIFGRADEEIDALEQAGISYDIVPGITAAAAAAAEIGASLTTRGHNRAVALLTGHDAKGFAEHDWKAISLPGARAAVYMGVGASRFIQGRMLLHGSPRDLPVTVVENASRPNQIIVPTTLGNLAQDIEIKDIKGPAILLLGYEARGIAIETALSEAAL